MREVHGLKGRVSNKVKAALLTLVAVFAMSAIGASQASAAQQLKLSFNDSWIGVPALEGLGAGTFHAIDPADGKNLKIDLDGSLAANGDFSAPASAFNFPTQVIDAGDPIGNVNLNILATKPITGNYNSATGAFSADLSLKLTVEVSSMGVLCAIEPLNIPLATSGSNNFGAEGGDKAGAAFANGSGAVLGSWSGVTVANVSQVTPPAATDEDNLCKMVINGLIKDLPDPSFDGTIWLAGTAQVTGTPDVVTPPETAAKVGKITAAKKGKVKKGKAVTIKVKVTNTGGKVLTGKLAIKSSNKQVKAPKSAKLKVQPGKTQTIKVKVKASKKAKGKAKITFSAGGKKAVTTLTVKK